MEREVVKNIEKFVAQRLREEYGKDDLQVFKVDGYKGTNDYLVINESKKQFDVYAFVFLREKVEKKATRVTYLESMSLVDSISYESLTEVTIDRFATVAHFTFNTGATIKIVNLSDDIKTFTARLEELGVTTNLLERKWYNKILGFRSKKKWKMVTATLIYLMIFGATAGMFTEEEEPVTEEVVASEEQTEETTTEVDKQAEEGKKAEEEKKTQEEKVAAEQKEKEKKELEEKEMKEQEAEHNDKIVALNDDITAGIKEFDKIWEDKWRYTFLNVESIDRFTAYKNMEEMREQYDALKETVGGYDLEFLNEEDYEDVNKFTDDIRLSMEFRYQAGKKAMELFDSGNVTPSQADAILTEVDGSDEFLMSSVTSLAKFQTRHGLAEVEEVVEEEATEEVAQEEAASNEVPTEWQNALDKAYTYADVMHMSKAGIYDQLVSEYGEGFPAEAAQYAIDTIEWDWNSNALESAKTYQEVMSMSHAAIYDQLISDYGEKFTPEEAQYAVDNLQ